MGKNIQKALASTFSIPANTKVFSRSINTFNKWMMLIGYCVIALSPQVVSAEFESSISKFSFALGAAFFYR